MQSHDSKKPRPLDANQGSGADNQNTISPTKDNSPAAELKARVRKLLGPVVDLYLQARKGYDHGR